VLNSASASTQPAALTAEEAEFMRTLISEEAPDATEVRRTRNEVLAGTFSGLKSEFTREGRYGWFCSEHLRWVQQQKQQLGAEGS
jgi:hypothetical protein